MVDTISSGSIPPSVAANPDRLDPEFMYCQLLKEKFLHIDYDPSSITDLVNYCRPRYADDPDEKRELEEFARTYRKHSEEQSPIWWYTKECFLYKMLNRALRTLDMVTLMKYNFYIRDLHEQIKQRFDRNQHQIPAFVYRGQRLSHADWDKLTKSVGGLQYFNCFLSSSEDKENGLFFAERDKEPSTVGVLFRMRIDRSNASIPFTSIEEISAIENEREVLFSIGSVFRIDQIGEAKADVWQVDLTLCKDRDPELTRLMDYIRRSLGQGSEWRQLGQLMLKMGHFATGRDIFLQLRRQAEEPAELMFLHNQLGHCEKQLAHLQQALEHYQKVIDISRQLSIPLLDSRLSSTYSNIGVIWKQMKNFDEALKYFQLVLQIDENAKEPNRLDIATDYNNIGSVFDEQEKYTEALEYYQKSLKRKLVSFPTGHPSVANSYLNIGTVYRKMGKSAESLECYEKALEIQKRSLPPNHPSFIGTFSNMSILHEQLGQYSSAIQRAEDASRIAALAFGQTHPETDRREERVRTLRKIRP